MPNYGPGYEIAGRYRLLELLGRGGMGEVWRAEHLALHSQVAVKLIDPRTAADENVVRRFMQEARAAAALESPHVVRTTDFGVAEGTPFIVMELLTGESLSQRLERQHRLTPVETARVIRHVARAVGKAHLAGFVHRDLKPDNIFIVMNDDEELVKVLDFGIAKALVGNFADSAAKTRTGALLGTPYYMSPEQAQGDRRVDFRSDLWAMGVIAFECLTGKRPFESEGLGSLVLQICAGPIPVPSQIAPVPPGFDDWFAHAVCRDPEGRFQSARELATLLRHVLTPTDLGEGTATGLSHVQWPAPTEWQQSAAYQSISGVLPVPAQPSSPYAAVTTSTDGSGAAAPAPIPGAVPAPQQTATPQPGAPWLPPSRELGQTTGGAASGEVSVPMHRNGLAWIVAMLVITAFGAGGTFVVMRVIGKRSTTQAESAQSSLAPSAPSMAESAVEPALPAPPPSAQPDTADASPPTPVVEREAPSRATKPSASPHKDPGKASPPSSATGKNRLGF